MRTKRLRISGLVQGVWFRAWSVERAQALGLRGWVRNRKDGTVEILVHGEDEAIERMIAQAGQGPASARVERVEVEETDEPAPAGFKTRATA